MTEKKLSFERVEGLREYLRLLVRTHLDPALRGRIDTSDMVQEVLLKAYQAIESFQWKSEAELLAWLRAIVINALRDALRRNLAEVRDVRREQSLEDQLNESSARLESLLAHSNVSPGQQVVQQEQMVALANALAQLPDDQREAIELKHVQGYSVAEVGEQLGKSRAAVAGLLRRGLERLRLLLDDSE